MKTWFEKAIKKNEIRQIMSDVLDDSFKVYPVYYDYRARQFWREGIIPKAHRQRILDAVIELNDKYPPKFVYSRKV